ncbi:DUF3558 domain-containing protein [Streptomyces sp. DSM 44917]|uniref:DUF3558 domain-containing protein n=1 Tax=Streptomyces boetiae TaxID=3075541 RepID=A0ABU2LDH3_9ACTN|nr:DUF3558 domain-containing protein [Streptomyces sp. DSM 44917]MDT0309631.1 DUF3558 domain-containing protein [Streptomyces sp. DSM 44917]
MDRTALRGPARVAGRALAWTAVPLLLLVGCSSGSGSDGGTQDDEPRESVAPEPEPVRFSALPEPCATLNEDVIGEVVPEADPAGGETLSSFDTAFSGACLWNGLEQYQYRSLQVALRRFDSDVALGSGDERAGEYLRQMAEEVSGDEANGEVEQAELDDAGDEAATLSYTATRTPGGEEDDEEQEYRQQRVVVRTANVVITVDYAGAGLEGDDMPSADSIREAAETAARAVTETVNASTEQPAEEEPPADEG